MSVNFSGTAESLDVVAAPISSLPFSYACWFNSDIETTRMDLFTLYDTTAGEGFRIVLDKDPVNAVRFAAPGGQVANTSTGYSSGTWHHALATAASSTDRKIFIDGGSAGESTGGELWLTAADEVRIAEASGEFNFNGLACEFAIWNADLSGAADRLALASGRSPLFVKPQNLVGYWKLRNTTEYGDVILGNDLAETGTPDDAVHVPKIIYPAPPLIPAFSPAAAVGQWPFWYLHYHMLDELQFQFLAGVIAAGQPTYKRSQGIPTAAGYRDRPGKGN